MSTIQALWRKEFWRGRVTTGDRDEQGWMKRLQWAQSAIPLLDHRINALASLWTEGVLSARELLPDVRSAIQESTVRPDIARDGNGIAQFADNIRVAAQWMAFLQVIHFCDQHQWRTRSEKLAAFHLFKRELDVTGPSVGGGGSSWIADVCEFRSQTENVGDPMHQLVRRWVVGTDIRDHEDLIEQSVAVREPLRTARRADATEPETAVGRWIDALRADVQGLVLRETDAYCRAAGLNTSADRVQAWRTLLDELQRPSRGHEI